MATDVKSLSVVVVWLDDERRQSKDDEHQTTDKMNCCTDIFNVSMLNNNRYSYKSVAGSPGQHAVYTSGTMSLSQQGWMLPRRALHGLGSGAD